ncbi:MAG TPA: hypothetical protein VHA07_12275 [Devosia sp.]|nr:hypothetical protein [Devosia sp.]
MILLSRTLQLAFAALLLALEFPQGATGAALPAGPAEVEGPVSIALLNWSIRNPQRLVPALGGARVSVRFQQALRIDADDTARDLIGISQAEGVRQIRQLGQSTRVEEAWAYVPQAGFWVEIGIYGRDDLSLGPLVELDVALLGGLIAAFDRVDIYHLHPDSTFAAAFGVTTLYPSDTPVAMLDDTGKTAVGLAVPSPSDIETAIDIALLQDELHPSSEVRNHVVTPYGVVQYELTARGRTDIALNLGNPIRSLDSSLITMSAIRRAPFNIVRTADENAAMTIGGLIEALCAQLSGDNLSVVLLDRW